ncbi:hypothetical protein BRADO0788 [Bradyrhizobium sp. ORS 278]|uniref:hypothetical protein n=1 Tax=Bradyrhizobium sp. (strain ORS 278) TaxID=114615 RepID=UPI00015077D2|nr:hypothetical protein [Bradyrhizobium sp. ORS 278]CAL74711.1 hypothetical protein BRADO0788 [Bradyrhizobium sp. ORS 278]
MSNDQSANRIEALGRSKSATAGDDRGLLALEAQLDDLVAQLLAAQEANGALITSSDPPPAVPDDASGGTENALVSEAQEKCVEAILARLHPIERAIMAAPAYSIVGLGVKARHAAYVMSQYWDGPTDKIDWEAQAIRLLIEAVCEVARTPLSFRMRGN